MLLVDRMTMLVQTPNEEESNEYFTPLQSLKCNEGGRLKNNREDENSHLKILRTRKSNIVEVLKEELGENIYLIPTQSAQDKLL
jgi:hypothetical protein